MRTPHAKDDNDDDNNIVEHFRRASVYRQGCHIYIYMRVFRVYRMLLDDRDRRDCDAVLCVWFWPNVKGRGRRILTENRRTVTVDIDRFALFSCDILFGEFCILLAKEMSAAAYKIRTDFMCDLTCSGQNLI